MPPRLRKKSKVQEATREESGPTMSSAPALELPEGPVSPPSPGSRPQRGGRSLLSRQSMTSLRDRVAQGVVRGGKIMRGGFANLGEGFSRMTDPTGTRRNVSDPLRSSTTGSHETNDNQHSNESSDQLSPLLESTPANCDLRERLKRPRRSDTPSDSDGSLSGGSQDQAWKTAAVSTRPVSEMGVLQPRPEQVSSTVLDPAEQRSGTGQDFDPGVKVPLRDAADARPTRTSGQTAYPTPPPTEPSKRPAAATDKPPSSLQRDASPSPLPLPPTFASLLIPSPSPERPGVSLITTAQQDPLPATSHGISQSLFDTETIWNRIGQALDSAWTQERQALLEIRQALSEQGQALAAERQALAAERQALAAERQGSTAGLSKAMTEPGQHSAAEAGVKIEQGSTPRSAAELLQDVRQSFMRMAPRAFELGKMTDLNAINTLKPLSQEQQIDLWTKVWDSFDFNDSQRIDVEQKWDELPADMQILCLALSEWTQFEEKDDHGIRDLVYEKGLRFDRSPLSRHQVDITLGLDRWEKFLRFKRALQPHPPTGSAGSFTPGVPFAWLDVHLSHFRHLGWRLLEEPDYDGNMIDYNDFAYDQDPRAEFINKPEDHFRLWQEGGLLMTDVRVPLPKPLFRSKSSLGKALGLVYSVRHHPLCMLEGAWRFAKELCETPSNEDLRAALLYQIVFCLHRRGPIALWSLLGVPAEQQLS